MKDAFIRMYIEDVTSNIRKQVLLRLIRPYRCIELDFVAKQLGVGITSTEVEELLVGLILDEKVFFSYRVRVMHHDLKVAGLIDQEHGRFEVLNHAVSHDPMVQQRHRRYDALQRWQKQLDFMVERIVQK